MNIGAGLAILGNRVLLVDLDPQAHLTRFLGIERGTIKKTIFDVLSNGFDPHEAVVKRTLKARMHMDGHDNEIAISLIPCAVEFANAEVTLSRVSRPEFLLKKVVDEVRNDYDYILLDCSPSLGLVSTNALIAAQTVFVPVQTEYLALHSLDDLMTKIYAVMAQLNSDLDIGGFIATRFDGRKVLSRTVVQTMRERYGALLFDTMIRDNIVLAESPQYGKDIFSYRSRSFGAEDYLKVAEEVMERMSNGEPAESNEFDALETYVGRPT